MKTPEQKLQHIVEQIDGMCWHERVNNEIPMPNGYGIILQCCKCSVEGRVETCNPSPDDIGKLMELAEKLGWPDIVSGQTADGDYFADLINSDAEVMLGNSRGEALLNALFVAKGGLEDE